MVATSEEMDQREKLLSAWAIIIIEDGALGVQSREEVKDIIQHHLGISKHNFYVYRSSLEPLIALFHDARDRDIAFAAGRIVDGPVDLGLHPWDIGIHGVWRIVPYNVKISLEGLPQHAWFKDVADKVHGDEALIHHVDEETALRSDQRAFVCWALSEDP
jgi:hypothetical protein